MVHSLTQSTIEPQVLRMLDLVSYQEGAVFREVLRKKSGTVTLFAFDEGQLLSEHTAPFDAVANLIEGDREITISGLPLNVKAASLSSCPPSAARTEGKRQIEDAFDHDSVAGLRQAGTS